jgi:hypothetical protein
MRFARFGKRLLFGCALALLAAGQPRQSPAAAAPIQLGRGEVLLKCPAECSVPITITSVLSIRSASGQKAQVDWRLGAVPSDLKVNSVSVVAEVTLEDGAVLDGSISVKPSITSVTVPVRGGFLNLNKGKGEGVKKVKATVHVTSFFKEELAQPQNIKVARGGEVFVEERRGALFADEVKVTWDFLDWPCDTVRGFEIEVSVEPRRLVSNDVVRGTAATAERSKVFRLNGLAQRKDNFTINARVRPLNRQPITCSAIKSVTIGPR